MDRFDIFARLVAISIVGGVAKSLFGPTKPSGTVLSAVGDSITKNISETARRGSS